MATTSNQVKINIDNEEVILTGNALDAFEADRAEELARQLAAEKAVLEAIKAKEAARNSAIAKLETLGLTADEVTSLLA